VYQAGSGLDWWTNWKSRENSRCMILRALTVKTAPFCVDGDSRAKPQTTGWTEFFRRDGEASEDIRGHSADGGEGRVNTC